MTISSIIAHFVNPRKSMYPGEACALTGILASVIGVGAPGPVLDRSGHLLHGKNFGLDMASALGIASLGLSIVRRLGGPSIGVNRISALTPRVASMLNVS